MQSFDVISPFRPVFVFHEDGAKTGWDRGGRERERERERER